MSVIRDNDWEKAAINLGAWFDERPRRPQRAAFVLDSIDFVQARARELFWTDARALAVESRLAEPNVSAATRRRQIWETETALREECIERARRMAEV